jgi:hypothetical protein
MAALGTSYICMYAQPVAAPCASPSRIPWSTMPLKFAFALCSLSMVGSFLVEDRFNSNTALVWLAQGVARQAPINTVAPPSTLAHIAGQGHDASAVALEACWRVAAHILYHLPPLRRGRQRWQAIATSSGMDYTHRWATPRGRARAAPAVKYRIGRPVKKFSRIEKTDFFRASPPRSGRIACGLR